MIRRLSGIILVISIVVSARGQEYRLVLSSPLMPDMNTPVAIVAERNDGNGFKALPAKKYSLESRDATPVAGNMRSSFFRLNRAAVYSNKGKATFTLRADGKAIPLTLEVPVLTDMKFSLYTDSIKPVLNYYVAMNGFFSDGKAFPLDTSLINISADHGSMAGMEWVLPREHNFEKVTFKATGKYDQALTKTITVYLKKYKDPRDDINYQDRTEDEVKRGINKR